MNEAEGLNFSVGVPSDGGDDGRRRIRPKVARQSNPSLQDVLDFIGRLSITDSDKERLVIAAKKVPHGALANFRANYMTYLRKGGRR